MNPDRDQTPPSTNRKIAAVSALLIFIAALSHALSLVKEVIVAKFFGITCTLDAFYAALSVPNAITNILLSTFSMVFIPVFATFRVKNKSEGDKAASIILNWAVILSLASTAVIFIFASPLESLAFHGLEGRTLALAIRLLRLLCFTLLFSSAIGVVTGILNATEHFFWPSVSQSFVTISTISLMLVFAAKWGVYVLVWGLLGGLAIQCFSLMFVTKYYKFQYSFSLDWKHPAVKETLSSFTIFLIAMSATQFNPVIDQVMASYLSSGSISALNYASKLVQVPFLIFSTSIVTAVFPYFSNQVAENKIEELKYSLSKTIRMLGFIFFPLTTILILLAKPLIQLLFERGAFDPAATGLISVVFSCYLLQLFFHTTGIILGRVVLAMKEFKIFLKLMSISILLNIALNLLFIKLISPPVAGIALSTSVFHLLMMTILAVLLKKRNITIDTGYVAYGLLRFAVFSLLAGIGVYCLFGILEAVLTYRFMIKRSLSLIISGLAGMFFFTFLCHWAKLDELKSLKLLLRGGIPVN